MHDGTTGKELWSVRTEQPIYERLFSVADVNADSILDLCIVTHLSGGDVRRHDGQTAAQNPLERGPQLWIQYWGNYDSDPQLECVILSDYTVHVDYLETGPHGTARHGWGAIYRRNRNENAAIDFTHGRRALRFLYGSVTDLNGDGTSETAYLVHNLEDQRQWRTLVRGLPHGEVLADRENVYLYGIVDADGDEFVVERDTNRDGLADGIEVLTLRPDGRLTRVRSYGDPH